MKVLFICVGNINRSIAAQIVCKTLYPNLHVKSCGLNGREGVLITKKMRLVLVESGYVIDKEYRSNGISEQLVQWADKLVVADNANKKRLEIAFPEIKKNIEVIGAKDPHFHQGTEHHKLALQTIEKYLRCAVW